MSETSIVVRLEDHVVSRQSKIWGRTTETIPQKRIFVSIDGRPEERIGLIGNDPGSKVMLTDRGTSMPTSILELVTAEVRRLMPTASAVVPTPPVKIEKDDLEDDTDIEDLEEESRD